MMVAPEVGAPHAATSELERILASHMPAGHDIQAVLRTLGPQHHSTLAKLQDRPGAMAAFLKRAAEDAMLAETPRQVAAAETPRQVAAADTPRQVAAADSAMPGSTVFGEIEMENEYLTAYKDMLGTDIVVKEDDDEEWVMIPEVVKGRSKVSGGALLGASAVATSTANAAAMEASAAARAAMEAAMEASAAASAANRLTAQLVTVTPAGLFEKLSSLAPASANGDGVAVKAMQALHKRTGFSAAEVQRVKAAADLAKKHANLTAVTSRWCAAGGTVLTVGMLGYEFYTEIRKYYKKEIDGLKCAENLSAAVFCSASSVGGGLAGASLCAGAALPGLIFGGVCGAMIAASITNVAVRSAFEALLGDDRARSLRQAYQVLSLQPSATAEEVRASYLRLAKATHPDKKGGDEVKFLQINASYELIRASHFAS